MQPHLIAVDLDATLLDSRGHLPDRNRAALHLAHEQGHKVVLCTGRTYTETRPVLDAIGLDLDATVTIGGALISEARGGRTIARTPLDATVARDVFAWHARRDYPVMWVHDPTEHGCDGYLIGYGHRHPAIDRWLELSPCRIEIAQRPPAAAGGALRLSIVDQTRALHELADAFIAAFAGRVQYHVIDVPAYEFTVLEAFDARVNKWAGIVTLCERWEIDPRQTIALGDDVNDAIMLAQAGRGIAMGNATASARQAAGEVTLSNDECGVAVALERILAGG